MPGQDDLSTSFVETLAGFTAGVVSTLCVHPLDLVKTRLQGRWLHSILPRPGSQSNRKFHQLGTSASTVETGPPLPRRTIFWRQAPQVVNPSIPSHCTFKLMNLFSGGLTCVLTNPIWVIKTRMLSTGSQVPGAYSSLLSGVRQIYHTEGILGFYRGLVPALFGVSHGALQFMAYEQLKNIRLHSIYGKPAEDRMSDARIPPALGTMDLLGLSSLSKLFAGCITYPYQVVRSRLQTYGAHLLYRGTADAVKQIWMREGLVGFYKGLGPNLFRVLPSTWVTFLVYEKMRAFLYQLHN
ncbi:hypothetical protein N7468_001929 [Penicillium chermesinum]|uniref:Mitochondrial thiamine pyrophosphate carrier 1 n=1 Tax=Penicillium chermesinum TaxID=63820 RepID=A0A9W9PHI0_9EURO|nr:uncharacterized protein N7468_001929 [Penicillium chermesinum]KAJ5246946.1 hypothetical protein N7468_001929 [Penicillium chermesinum]KAJ6145200.1 hypothetical protein N7470_009095 [Penicillium chermesinum]